MTPRDEATALLAAALEAADLAPSVEIDAEGWPVISDDDDRHMLLVSAKSILLASPTLAADLEFAAAWRRVERALPEGARMVVRADGPGWSGSATTTDQLDATASLTRLAETMEAM